MAKSYATMISKNKLFAFLLILTIVISGSTFVLAPTQSPGSQLVTINVPGKGDFDLNAYPYLDRRVIGLVNLFRDYYRVTDLSNSSVNDLSMLPSIFTHYFLAFTTYGMAKIADSTPGYRTDYYKEIFHKLIAMMNSSAMKQHEWFNPGFSDQTYSSLGNGFNGPTNIMWTGHYTLMELFYYSLFHDDRYNAEIQKYLDQWNSSLTSSTLWDGSPSGGLGRWGTGLIPCEPYIVFVQCNSIPFYTMRLYDNLHSTNYQKASLPGIEWWQKNMVDMNGIPIDGYYVAQPLDKHKGQGGSDQTYPGYAETKGISAPKVSAYGTAWIIMLYKGMGMTALADKLYSSWKQQFVHYSSSDTAYVVESYYYPHEFGVYDLVSNLFAYFCSAEMGDSVLNNKLENWFYSPFEGSWRGDKYMFDTSILGSQSSFAFPVINFAWAWAHSESTLGDLMRERDDAYFEYPFIKDESTKEELFINQAYYDSSRGAFILTVEAANYTALTFENFPNVQGVYTSQGAYTGWTQNGSKMALTLNPGVYSFVII